MSPTGRTLANREANEFFQVEVFSLSSLPCFAYLRLVHSKVLLALISVLLCPALTAQAASAKVIKVLPHLLDREGRHSLSPSLYERDAYQARLRQHPELRAGLRFDVQWKARRLPEVKLIVEMRGAKGKEPTAAILQEHMKAGRVFSKWSALQLAGEDYARFGDLIAWRVSLWDGRTLLAEQKSFLW